MRAERNAGETAEPTYVVQINPQKMKEVITTELQTRATEKVRTRSREIAKNMMKNQPEEE